MHLNLSERKTIALDLKAAANVKILSYSPPLQAQTMKVQYEAWVRMLAQGTS